MGEVPSKCSGRQAGLSSSAISQVGATQAQFGYSLSYKEPRNRKEENKD